MNHIVRAMTEAVLSIRFLVPTFDLIFSSVNLRWPTPLVHYSPCEPSFAIRYRSV